MRRAEASGGRALWALFLALCWMAMLLAGAAHARGTPEPPDTGVPLAGAAQAWIDESGARPAESVAHDDLPWQPLRAGAIHPLTTGKALWIRFDAPPSAEGWLLEIDYPSLNRATLYLLGEDGIRLAGQAGDSLPVASWPIPYRHPLLPVSAHPGGASRYLVRLENPHSFSAPLRLVRWREVGLGQQRSSFLLGLYFGIAALAAAMALLAAVTMRDATYARYVGAVVAMAFAQAAATGIGGLLLWPHSAGWNDVAPLALPVIAGAAFLFFLADALSLDQRSRRLNAAVLAIAAAGVVLAACIAWVVPASLRFRLQVPYVALACAASVGALVWAGRRGDRHARWMLLALLPVALSACLPLAGTLGLIPVSATTLHAMPVAISLELPAVLVILLMRNQERRGLAVRVLDLYRNDPATGLPNAREFERRLRALLDRSRRMGYASVAMLVEVADPGRAAATHAAQGSQLALHLAGRLLSVAREVDTVARVGDHRFGMLLEGPLRPEDVESAGQRVVARCLMPVKGRPLAQVIKVRVAVAVLPRDGTDALEILAALHRTLAQPEEGSTRAVLPIAALSPRA